VHAVGRVDLHVEGHQLAQAARAEVILPNIILRANPTIGITNIPAWYWVDRGSYDGHLIVQPLHQDFPWELEWTETVHHENPCPTVEDPDKTCGSDSEEPHSETHLDTVDVTDALDPAQFVWGWGDGTQSGTFNGPDGLGRPYTSGKVPSPVVHNYEWSSLKQVDQGGFQITLTLSWSVSYLIVGNSDLGGGFVETGQLQDRVGEWSAPYQVREVRSVVTR
jgi:hypothetical protein